jgi:hypothetical protein
MAVNVTVVPPSKYAAHVLPQLMPDGLLVIVPPVPPVTCVVNMNRKVAVTLLAEFIVMLQVMLDTVQAPVHPMNVAPLSGRALSTTVVPESNVLEHDAPQ